MARGNSRAKTAEDILLTAEGAIGALIPPLFASPVMGVAVLDSRVRFRAINGALAAMNGLPVSASSQSGKSLRLALGPAMRQIEPLARQVLETGEPIANLECTAKLPGRKNVCSWLETYLPIRGMENRITAVVAIIVELMDARNVRTSLKEAIGELAHASAALRTELPGRGSMGRGPGETGGPLSHAIELIDNCLRTAKSVDETLSRTLAVHERLRIPVVGHEAGPQRDDSSDVKTLSRREYEVLGLLAGGHSNKEVACHIGISVRTVETYRARIFLKLGLRSIGHLVRFAVRNRIIEA